MIMFTQIIESETTWMQLPFYGSCNHIIVPSVVEFKVAEVIKCSFQLQLSCIGKQTIFQVIELERKFANFDNKIQTEKRLLILHFSCGKLAYS